MGSEEDLRTNNLLILARSAQTDRGVYRHYRQGVYRHYRQGSIQTLQTEGYTDTFGYLELDTRGRGYTDTFGCLE